MASSCFIRQVSVSLHLKGGSSTVTSFGVNLQYFSYSAALRYKS